MQVPQDVLFLWRHLVDVTQALLRKLQVPALDVDDAQVVARLDVVGFVLEDRAVVLLGRVHVLQLVHVDVCQQDERLAVSGVILKRKHPIIERHHHHLTLKTTHDHFYTQSLNRVMTCILLVINSGSNFEQPRS